MPGARVKLHANEGENPWRQEVITGEPTQRPDPQPTQIQLTALARHTSRLSAFGETQGMGDTVELLRSSGKPDRDRFSCPLPVWEFMRELGETFGWQPAGTTYVPEPKRRTSPPPVRHDYDPGGTQDRKQIEAEDAANWASAIESAMGSPYLSGMLDAQARLEKPGSHGEQQLLLELLNDFVEFARAGAFTVSLNREKANTKQRAPRGQQSRPK